MAIREAVPGDYEAFVRLFATLETGDPTPTSEAWAAQLAPDALVATHDGRTAGYLYFQVLGDLGYVRHLAVDPAQRRRGIGRGLMMRAAEAMTTRGAREWCLNVKPDNVAAIALYQKLGMTQRHTSVATRMHWTIVDRLPQGEATVRPLTPDHDPEAEQTFVIPHGLLAQQRSCAGSHLFVADHAGTMVGLAAFRPEFPGAFPFRANSTATARALLEAMTPHARPEPDYVQLVLENADVLANDLVTAGAWRHLEIVHLRGPLSRRRRG